MREKQQNFKIMTTTKDNIMEILKIHVYKTEIKVRLKVKDNYKRTQTVYIVPCYDSYEQYGATTDVLWFTLPIAEILTKTNYFKGRNKDTETIKQIILNRF